MNIELNSKNLAGRLREANLNRRLASLEYFMKIMVNYLVETTFLDYWYMFYGIEFNIAFATEHQA